MKADDITLWARLCELGLADGEMPSGQSGHAPWYVRVMMGIAGWLGALFLLGFFVITFSLFKSDSFALVLGLLLCIAAIFIFRMNEFEDFGQQFGLAISIAGQLMVFFGLLKNGFAAGSHIDVALKMACIEILLFLSISHPVHRLWSAVTGLYALIYVANQIGLNTLSPAVLTFIAAILWLNEFKYPLHASAVRCVGYAALIMACLPMFEFPLLAFLGFFQASTTGNWNAGLQLWLAMLISASALLAVVRVLLSRGGIPQKSRSALLAYAAVTGIVAASFWMPGITVIMIATVLGFAHGNRILVGLSAAAMLVYLSQYYYWLEVSLLHKSLLLMAMGAALLVLRLAMRQLLSARDESGVSHA